MEKVNVVSDQISDGILKSVASELNQVLKLEPQIDVENLKNDLLLSAIAVASQLIWETDDLSESTTKILQHLNLAPFDNQEAKEADNVETQKQMSKHVVTNEKKITTNTNKSHRKAANKTPTDPEVKQFITSLLKERKYQKKDIVKLVSDKFNVNKYTLNGFLQRCYKADTSSLDNGYIGKDGKILYFISLDK